MIGRVYQLICPLKKEPIYIGSTTLLLKDRLCGHLNTGAKIQTAVRRYIVKNQVRPKIELLEEVEVSSSDELRKVEYEYIEKLKTEFKLLNINTGGNSSRGVRLRDNVWRSLEIMAEINGVKLNEQIAMVLENYILKESEKVKG